MKQINHLINGASEIATSNRTSPVFNPATGQQTANVSLASAEDVDAAVSAAEQAFVEWRQESLATRTKLMFQFRNLVEDHTDDLARAITLEHGKVLSDAAGEVARGLENIEFACGIAQHLKGSYNASAATGINVYTLRQPLGVVAAITPFNFPVMVPLWTIPNAIAAGNTYVLKPSERDPSAALLLAELFREAGFPNGVLNVVQGDKVAVDCLLQHPTVQAISFVGSTPVAQHVYETGTKNGKRVQALAGAKNHMVVLPDADLDVAADAAVSAAYGSAGERCMAISVLVAVGSIADELIDAIRDRIVKLKVGDGTDDSSEMGPLVTEEHRSRVSGYIAQGAEDGASVVVDGRNQNFDGKGYFLAPTLIDHVSTDMSVYTDEIFGPVLSVVRTNTYEEALQLIQDNRWGNGAAIFTRHGGAARAFQDEVEAGMVGINVPIPVPVGYHSFGGWNDSLFGDTSMYGPDGVRFFTRPKVVTSRWSSLEESSVDLGFPRNS